MFIAKNEDLIIRVDNTKEALEEYLKALGAIYTSIEETDIEYIFYNGQYLTEEEIALQEHDRIQELFMTRSDFFDGTIMAWGADEDMLKPLIITMVNSLPLDDRLKLKALNNFKNALNFYRKHALFNMLVNTPIQLTETTQIIMTDEGLDKYFDEVAKGNKDTAWKYLPQPITIPIETDTIEKSLYDDA